MKITRILKTCFKSNYAKYSKIHWKLQEVLHWKGVIKYYTLHMSTHIHLQRIQYDTFKALTKSAIRLQFRIT